MFERYAARRTILAVAALVAVAGASACGTATADGVRPSPAATAEVDAFAPDLLHGDNGLPASSQLPLGHGLIATPVGTDGDALDAHEGQHLAHFGGEYYLYGVRFGCGTHIDISHDRPFCGFSSYVSDDLTHWRPKGGMPASRLKKACSGYCGSPTVIFSPHLRRYLMYFTGDSGTSHRWLAESHSPTGPWRNLRHPKLQHGDLGRYDIAVGADGTAYMFENQDKAGLPTDIWMETLNAGYTGASGNAVKVASGPYSGVNVFQHGTSWYMTIISGARYFGPARLSYLRARSPAGPWQGASGTPRTLSEDTCGGTAQSLSVLPSARGPVPVEAIDLYRSSPGDVDPKLPPRAWHGDWNQAIAGRLWAPLSFDRSGEITPLTCESATHIPLVKAARTSRSPVQQPDCRVTATGVLRQSWTVPPGRSMSAVRVPVYQRAYVTDPMLAPKDEPPTAVNAPLTVELTGPDGTRRTTVRASEVSWAPASVAVRLPRPVRAGAELTLRLRTTATDGCYGVLVDAAGAPMPAQADVSGDRYGAVENGRPRPAPGARMLLF